MPEDTDSRGTASEQIVDYDAFLSHASADKRRMVTVSACRKYSDLLGPQDRGAGDQAPPRESADWLRWLFSRKAWVALQGQALWAHSRSASRDHAQDAHAPATLPRLPPAGQG